MPRWAAVAAAAVLTLSVPAHVLHLGWAPSRAEWWALWAGLTLAAYPVLGPAVRWAAPHLRAGGRTAVALPLIAGVLAAGWWHDGLLDILWLLGGRTRSVLLPLLHLSHAAVVASGVALLVAALVATDPPAEQELDRPRQPVPWAAVAGFTLACCLFTVWYVGREQTVYASDFMYYWDRAAGWAGRLRADPAAGADEFRRSVQRDNYTLLPVLPAGLAMAVFGDHRLTFVLAVVVAYLPPLALAGVGFARLAAPGRPVVLPVLLAVGLCPVTWTPILRGFPDVGGVSLAVASLLVYLRRPPGRLRWAELVVLAALLVGLVLFRRWYAYWVAAFVVLVGADGVVAAVASCRRGDWRLAGRCLRPAVALGVLVPVGLALTAMPVLVQMAGNDYADAFSAYRADQPPGHRLTALVLIAGPVYVLGAGLAVIGLLPGPGRRPALFAAGMVPVMLAHFMRVQDPNPHHLYLLLPALALLPAAATARLPPLVLAPAAAVGVLFFVPSFAAEGDRWRHRLLPLAPVNTFRPSHRSDLDEFRRLAVFLDGRPAGESYVVVSSSVDLHASMVACLGRSLRLPFPAAGRQLTTQDVDKVYGFPASVFAAGLVLVADPPQTHLRPADQQTVLVPARHLLDGTGIGVAFDRLPETFAFDGGVTLRVFRRARPVPPAAFAAFADELRAAHPNHPRVFTPPPAVADSLAGP